PLFCRDLRIRFILTRLQPLDQKFAVIAVEHWINRERSYLQLIYKSPIFCSCSRNLSADFFVSPKRTRSLSTTSAGALSTKPGLASLVSVRVMSCSSLEISLFRRASSASLSISPAIGTSSSRLPISAVADMGASSVAFSQWILSNDASLLKED